MDKILSKTRYTLAVEGPAMIEKYTVVDGESVDILPRVKVSAGLRATHNIAKLCFEAPVSITIERIED